ncbi:metallophosphoesterase [Kistimonas scapharcae]|uniref:Metallophosphoesterase n=1 Tax=Kistimonas scapharcae TaxID=1036133 RepID=A0ABP8V427_9GAMM
MKIHVLSDLHLENFMHAIRFKACKGIPVDAVVLAGDIAEGTDGMAYTEDWYPDTPILYVPGNHEYYGHELNTINRRMEEFCRDTPIHLLNPGVVEIQDTVFIGCTLWTDFCLYGEQQANMALSERCLNDYRLISIADDEAERILTPEDTLTIHNQHRLFLETQLEAYQERRIVVITHHLPSEKSVKRSYRNDNLTTAFASSLDDLITRFQPALWIHGHSHYGVDYTIGSTRVVSNPRGYPGEFTYFEDDLVIEV